MIFGYITLFTALTISLSAAIYSILGLTAIFAAAFWPIVIMGSSLEVGKIVTTLWLHKYWDKAELQYKLYLCTAVAVLMFLTSMGVFGFLSKAHSDQALVSGDSGAKIAVYDEKIKIEKDNINANRKALQQMDAAVDQVMGRSTDEKGADKAVAIRRSQAKERSRLLAEITDSQKKVTALNEERIPLAAENRKVEAEVGPIKYIAALIYGDNPDANLLEHAVRWVIILIVSVFDPLALTLLLAATKSIEWEHGINLFNLEKKKREDKDEDEDKEDNKLKEWFNNAKNRAKFWDNKRKENSLDNVNRTIKDLEESQEKNYNTLDSFKNELENLEKINYEPDDGALTDEQVELIREMAKNDLPTGKVVTRSSLFDNPETVEEEFPFRGRGLQPAMPLTASYIQPTDDNSIIDEVSKLIADETLQATESEKKTDIETFGNELQKRAMQVWKISNPTETFQEYLDKLNQGKISKLPWLTEENINRLNLNGRDLANLKLSLDADNVRTPVAGEVKGFGVAFPATANKGDMFLRVDNLPSQLYKFNGVQWIRVNKNLSDSYIYDNAYIDHLIEKIGSGEYDPDLLSDIERERIAEKLKNNLG
jgi:hypothetical protein